MRSDVLKHKGSLGLVKQELYMGIVWGRYLPCSQVPNEPTTQRKEPGHPNMASVGPSGP